MEPPESSDLLAQTDDAATKRPLDLNQPRAVRQKVQGGVGGMPWQVSGSSQQLLGSAGVGPLGQPSVGSLGSLEDQLNRNGAGAGAGQGWAPQRQDAALLSLMTAQQSLLFPGGGGGGAFASGGGGPGGFPPHLQQQLGSAQQPQQFLGRDPLQQQDGGRRLGDGSGGPGGRGDEDNTERLVAAALEQATAAAAQAADLSQLPPSLLPQQLYYQQLFGGTAPPPPGGGPGPLGHWSASSTSSAELAGLLGAAGSLQLAPGGVLPPQSGSQQLLEQALAQVQKQRLALTLEQLLALRQELLSQVAKVNAQISHVEQQMEGERGFYTAGEGSRGAPLGGGLNPKQKFIEDVEALEVPSGPSGRGVTVSGLLQRGTWFSAVLALESATKAGVTSHNALVQFKKDILQNETGQAWVTDAKEKVSKWPVQSALDYHRASMWLVARQGRFSDYPEVAVEESWDMKATEWLAEHPVQKIVLRKANTRGSKIGPSWASPSGGASAPP